jgi:hypothetical protein
MRGLAIRGARNALADRLKILLDMNLSPSWIASQLLRLPMVPKRREEVESITFQPSS